MFCHGVCLMYYNMPYANPFLTQRPPCPRSSSTLASPVRNFLKRDSRVFTGVSLPDGSSHVYITLELDQALSAAVWGQLRGAALHTTLPERVPWLSARARFSR